jgi:alginate O-acetyltransferase complex protein AlgI
MVYLKRVVLADYIAVNFIDRVFANPTSYSGFEGLMALYGYSLQVYADFSGYTDIAIGIALLMGFRLPKNFDAPYKADSTGNFWKRWHISLSSWLKDYLYIPMGGNRGGSVFSFLSLAVIIGFVVLIAGTWKVGIALLGVVLIAVLLAKLIAPFKNWLITNVNIMLTMLLGGIWHGASWNFVVWGGLNGLGIAVYKLWRKISPWEKKDTWYKRAWAIFLTFNFITFTRIWFRSESFEKADQLIHQIRFNFQPEIIPEVLVAFKSAFLVMAAGYFIHWLPSSFKSWYRQKFIDLPFGLKVPAVITLIFIMYQFLAADLVPFIYFQF